MTLVRLADIKKRMLPLNPGELTEILELAEALLLRRQRDAEAARKHRAKKGTRR